VLSPVGEGARSILQYEIRGCPGDDDADVGVLGSNAMWTCRQIPTFQRSILSVSGLKMETVCSSEMLVSAC
jgi:hypothetical protein